MLTLQKGGFPRTFLSPLVMGVGLLVFTWTVVLTDEVPEQAGAPSEEREHVSLEDGKVVSGLRTWLKTIEAVGQGDGKFQSAQETDYLNHWLEVTKTNIKRFSKKKKVPKTKLEKYTAETRKHYADFARYTSLKDLLTSWEGLRKTSEGAAFVAKKRREFIAMQNPLFGAGGTDPYILFETIARESRPEPIKFDDVKLLITQRIVPADKTGNAPDFWAGVPGYIEFDLTNTGEDASEGAWINFQALSPKKKPLSLLAQVTSESMTCAERDGTTRVKCRTDSLEPGETKTVRVETLLGVGERLRLRAQNQFRTLAELSATAQSEEPAAEAKSIRNLIPLRRCVSAYHHNLSKPRLKRRFTELKDKIRRAASPSRQMSGKRLVKHEGKFMEGKAESRLVDYVIKNRGVDRWLFDISKFMDRDFSHDAMVSVLSLPIRLIRTSVPSRLCANPMDEIRRARRALSQRKAEVDRLSDAVIKASKERVGEFKDALQQGSTGDAVNETAKSFATDRAADVTAEAADAAADIIRWSKGAANVAKFAGKTVTVISFLNSVKSMVEATVAFNAAAPEAYNRFETLGLVESAAYLENLKKRYANLESAYTAYMNLIEEAYRKSCTCRDPF